MIKRTYEELEPYFPAGHFGVTCKRYHGKDETGAQKFWIGVSEFEPDGGADWAYDDNPLEKVYFVLEGEMTVTDKDGNKRTTAEVVADQVYFGDSKRDGDGGGYGNSGYSSGGYSGGGYASSGGYSAPAAPAAPSGFGAPAGGDQFAELSDDDGELPF